MSDACPLDGCSVNCAIYNSCPSHSAVCLGNRSACPPNTILNREGYTQPEVDGVIINELLQAMKDVLVDEFVNIQRRYGVSWQPSGPPVFDDFGQDAKIDGGDDDANYMTAMITQLEKLYGNGPVQNTDGTLGEPDTISYTPNGDIVYNTDKVITASMIIQLYTAINVLVTDCVCYANICTCNAFCNCHSECSCNTYY